MGRGLQVDVGLCPALPSLCVTLLTHPTQAHGAPSSGQHGELLVLQTSCPPCEHVCWDDAQMGICFQAMGGTSVLLDCASHFSLV